MTVVDLSTAKLNDATSGRAGFTQMVRSEWTKIRTVRSTWICMVLLVVTFIGCAILIPALQAHSWAEHKPSEKLAYDPVSITQLGLIFGQLIIGVFAALTITSEYSTGLIRTTLTAVPRRVTLVAAKATVVALLVFVVAEITAFASFFIGSATLLGFGGQHIKPGFSLEDQVRSVHVPVSSIGDPGVFWAVFRGGLYLVLIALFALGIGFILRSTAGAISLFVALFLVIPGIIQALPKNISKEIQPRLPSNLGAAMNSTHARATDFGGQLLSAWPATALLFFYCVVLIALGAWLFSKRDA